MTRMVRNCVASPATIPSERLQSVRIRPWSTICACPAKYFDSETGLHYNWHRYYDPGLGRYLRPDPIRLDGGINLYVYVGNSPLNLVDPYGLTTTGSAIGGIIGGLLGGLTGSYAGSTLGALAGTVALPIGGTLVGGVGGATAGGVLGAAAGSLLGAWIGDMVTGGDGGGGDCGKYTCIATCHETPYGGVSRNQRIINSQGSGPTRSMACQNAIKSCQGMAVPGTYTRHCNCPKCWTDRKV